jgi:16S rRNA (cytidine1402-2'-O)-methyltransferase
MHPTLYIVSTPIGNLDDISKRALDILKSVDCILCEDTRVTKKLLTKYQITTNLISYRQHSIRNPRKLEKILALLAAGKQLALVTDAGTPGISDPGNELIDYLLSFVDLEIIPIPGPSAVTAAISVCGFDMSRYTFIGFVPKKKRLKLLNSLKDLAWPFIYFDSPHRLIKNLEFIKKELGDRQVFVGRELTKLHEEHYRGPVTDVLEQLKASNPKGEVVVVVSVPGKNRTSN